MFYVSFFSTCSLALFLLFFFSSLCSYVLRTTHFPPPFISFFLSCVQIETALKDASIVINTSKTAKQQALAAIQQLKEEKVLPIERAQMRIRVQVPKKDGKSVKQNITPFVSTFEEEDWDFEYEAIIVIDPGQYRSVDEVIQTETKGKGTLEIMDLQIRDGGDDNFE